MGGFAQNFDRQVTPQAEGLPDIQGSVTLVAWNQAQSDVECGLVRSAGGALELTGSSRNILSGSLSGTGYKAREGFAINASKYNNIYGSSDHVTPENYTIKVWLRTA